jgi:two-component system chemotaxis response regulator CheB
MPIKILIVDDSALMRQLLSEILDAEPGFEVVGTAPDPVIARGKIKALNPDVITLDIEMPRMDGLDFLQRVMELRPTPVVIVSSLTQKGTDIALRALELGAVDVVGKPLADFVNGIARLREELVDKLRAASRARLRPRGRLGEQASAGPALATGSAIKMSSRIVAVGASTGGVEALQLLIADLPPDAPPILATQHMPPGFSAAFARRLDAECRMTVCEAQDRQRVQHGHVYLSNGRDHLRLARDGAHPICRLDSGPKVSGHRPSVDVLFQSVAEHAATQAIGIILTGMGRDGAAGLLAMRQAGARTFGECEASCLIYGMPRAAMEMGAVEAEMNIPQLAAAILA